MAIETSDEEFVEQVAGVFLGKLLEILVPIQPYIIYKNLTLDLEPSALSPEPKTLRLQQVKGSKFLSQMLSLMRHQYLG